MEKLKRSMVAKIIAVILFTLSVVTLTVSGIFVLYLVKSGAYVSGRKEEVREEMIEEIVSEYDTKALQYYEWYLEAIDFGDVPHFLSDFERNFAEKETNYAFVIEPADEKNTEYPALSNYQCNDYQYSDESIRQVCRQVDVKEISREIDILAELNKMGYEFELYDNYIEIYYDYGYEEYEERECVYQGDFAGFLENCWFRIGYESEIIIETPVESIWYRNVEDLIDDQEAFAYSAEDVYYELGEQYFDVSVEDGGLAEINIQLIYYRSIDVVLKSYVKTNLTANDDFGRSFELKYSYEIMEYSLPVFLTSMVLILLMAIFIIVSAGHKKGREEIQPNIFDRIPFDIVLVVYSIPFALLYTVLADYGFSYIHVVVSLCLVGVIGLLTALTLATLATRLKVGGLFKNTVVCKFLLWTVAVIRKAWGAFSRIIKHLWNNLNLYAKYLGVYFAVAGFELVFLMAESPLFYGMLFLEKIGFGLILAKAVIDMNSLKQGAEAIARGDTNSQLDVSTLKGEFRKHGETLNKIGDGIQVAVEERLKSERMKTELITNVSHDIKTPLTSIINYVDLISKEELGNPKAEEYIEVLRRQSDRLKKLIQDLIDASKASTGNMPVVLEKMNSCVLMEQLLGEYEEKFLGRGIKTLVNYHTQNTEIMADGKHIWRVFDNIFNNISKYAQNNTRVYVDVEEGEKFLQISVKNISKDQLNISGAELMERFVRGDSSRNTEGSGLGLSIAKSLVNIQGGDLEIIVDGDLFKVVLLLVRA